MKRKKIVLLITVFLVAGSITLLRAWGFWGHKKINHMAVFTLPPDMIGFYKRNIEFITEHAVDPDKRRYAVAAEAPRHYIDLDHYGSHPFDTLPEKWDDAVNFFTEDTLKAYGIVPWYVDQMLGRLTAAFKEGNPEKIIHLSADLGHYVADAHVPLHCTENYNGQMTNQVGIHGFWESRLPELYGDKYDYFTGRAEYIEKPLKKIWDIVKASYAEHDSVLDFERQLNAEFSPDQKYAFEQRGSTTVRVYSKEYSEAYNKMLGDMVERRMRESIMDVGSFWFTAWVNAGQPDINNLKEYAMSDEMKKQLEEEDKMWHSGKAPNSKGHDDDAN